MFENIEWLFFDVGSTLIDERTAYEHRLHEIDNEQFILGTTLAPDASGHDKQSSPREFFLGI